MGYELEGWSDLFVAGAGAAAALAGLVFVAVSINLDRILQFEGLPERALQTVLMLAIVVVISMLGLFPQSLEAFGVELLVLAVVYVAVLARTARSSLPGADSERSWRIGQTLVLGFGALPLLVGAVSVLAETGGGLYWVGAGLLGCVIGGIANAWVLLVEIQR